MPRARRPTSARARRRPRSAGRARTRASACIPAAASARSTPPRAPRASRARLGSRRGGLGGPRLLKLQLVRIVRAEGRDLVAASADELAQALLVARARGGVGLGERLEEAQHRRAFRRR